MCGIGQLSRRLLDAGQHLSPIVAALHLWPIGLWSLSAYVCRPFQCRTNKVVDMKNIMVAGFAVLLLLSGSAQADVNRMLQRSEEHTSELQSRENLVCRLLLEKKNIEIIK